MRAFLAWIYQNLDSAQIMEKYKNAPEGLKSD